MKQEKNEHIHDLCSAIDQAMGRQMQSPKDFDMLGEHISARLGKTVSSSTLKRLWGYVDAMGTPQAATLNTLASFIGFTDYEHFCRSLGADGRLPSNPVASRHVNVQEELATGDELTLSWQPGRLCRVRYLGDLSFKVIASVATRLQPGDSFQCSVIIEGEPLFLTNLQQPGRPVTNYVCGRNGGIRFER